MNPKIEFSFSKDASSEKIHIKRAHLIVNEKTKFIPTYDSNIPLVCFIYSFFIFLLSNWNFLLGLIGEKGSKLLYSYKYFLVISS